MLVEPIMRFLGGVALFLQSKGLSQLWHKMRAGGVAESPPPPPPAERVSSDSSSA
jgi:hypothetical protein